MDEDNLKRHTELLGRLDAMVMVLRRGSNYPSYKFNTGSDSQCYVQKNVHSFVDAIHNPNANPVQVTLMEEGVTMYSNTVAPGDTLPLYGMPFMRECVLVTDGAAITIWGRVRG